MALHEEYDNDNTQDQLQWLKHLEQERQHLSASVEETLADPSSSQHDQWVDEGPMDTSRKTTLIPPRLSLQSKMLPAVRGEGAGQSLTGTHQAMPSNTEQKNAAPQGQNVFKRIAQRLTAVFGTSEQEEVAAAAPEQEKTVVPERPRRQQTALLPAVPTVPSNALSESSSGAKPLVIDAVPSARQPAMPVQGTTMADTGKQRLAGRNTKVRLEAVSPPIAKQNVEQAYVKPMHGEIREPVDIVVRVRPRDKETPQDAVSRETPQRERLTPPAPSQGDGAVRGSVVSAERCSLSGAEVFESGQREHMVKNSNITALSVVQVMLTANPGPVAVHYVSLQPQVGFTIHLTGPASVKAPFNYIILLGELF